MNILINTVNRRELLMFCEGEAFELYRDDNDDEYEQGEWSSFRIFFSQNHFFQNSVF